MRALIISDNTRKRIRRAMDIAREHVIQLETIKKYAVPNTDHLALKNRPAGSLAVITPRSQNVRMPVGYRAAISFEEQSPGLCKHLSVSVDTPGAMPSVESVTMIAKEFGIDFPGPNILTIWTEEFDPGHSAVNMLALITVEEGKA